MKTAVQWLFEEYKKREIATDEMVELFEKAEQREKEQMKDAFAHGKYNTVTYNTSEQYYNETYKNK